MPRRQRGCPRSARIRRSLGHDGADLVAALQTIREIGDGQALDEAIDDAFPGARMEIESPHGRFETTMHQHGLLRPLKAVELSDGTLRYLLWIAALPSPRPSELLLLNEPETSLHPDLLPALGRLIAHASKSSQLFVVSHASRLIATLEALDCQPLTLEKGARRDASARRQRAGSAGVAWPSR
jgi:predicted ATPase